MQRNTFLLLLTFFAATAVTVQTAVIVECAGAFFVLFAKPQRYHGSNRYKSYHGTDGDKPIPAFAVIFGTANFFVYDDPSCFILAVLLQYVQKL